MKEATGELNMTVITVVAIAAIAGFFYVVLWPVLRNNITNAQRCASAVCGEPDTNGIATCSYIDENGEGKTIKCTSKGN